LAEEHSEEYQRRKTNMMDDVEQANLLSPTNLTDHNEIFLED
jgi:hypothetical protein